MELFENRLEDLKQVEELYERAFPASEKKAFSLILDNMSKGHVVIHSIYDDEFAGIAIVCMYKETVLLDYFALKEEKRGNGLGSKALKMLQEKYKEKRFLLEIESVYENCDNLMQRKQRRHFYIKNNMQSMGYFVDLFGVMMEVFYYQNKVDYKEYQNLYKYRFNRIIGEKIEIETY